MEQIDDVKMKFLDETIDILAEALQKLERLRQRAEQEMSIDRQNQELIKKMAKEITAIKQGVIG